MKKIVIALGAACAALIAIVGWESGRSARNAEEQAQPAEEISPAIANGSTGSESGSRVKQQDPKRPGQTQPSQQTVFSSRTNDQTNVLKSLIDSAPPDAKERLEKGGFPPLPAGDDVLKTPLTFVVNGRTQVVWAVSVTATNDVLRVQFYPRGAVTEIPGSNVVKVGKPSLDWRVK